MSPKTTALAIIEKDENILLIKRNNEPYKGYWALPGGHIEENELAEEAVKREIKEETNLEFNGQFFTYSDEVFPGKNWHAVALVFVGHGEGDVRIDDESTEFRWCSLEEIESIDLAFNHKKALEDYKNKFLEE